MSAPKSEFPKTYQHAVTKETRVASTVAQEVALKFDGYRLAEEKAEAKSEAPKPTPTAPKTAGGDK